MQRYTKRHRLYKMIRQSDDLRAEPALRAPRRIGSSSTCSQVSHGALASTIHRPAQLNCSRPRNDETDGSNVTLCFLRM